MPICSDIICDLFYYLHIKMDTKDIIIICEAVLLAVLLIVLMAVIVRGNGQSNSYFSRKPTPKEPTFRELLDERIERGRQVQADKEAVAEAKAAEAAEQARIDAEFRATRMAQEVQWRSTHRPRTSTWKNDTVEPGVGNWLWSKVPFQ